MALQCRIEPDRRLARLTFSAQVRGTDLSQALQGIYHDPAWQPGFDAIWDFSAMTGLVLEKDDLKDLVRLDGAYEEVAGPGRDVAVVAREMDYMLGRLHRVLAKRGPRENFLCRTREEAYALLVAGGDAGP